MPTRSARIASIAVVSVSRAKSFCFFSSLRKVVNFLGVSINW